MVALRLWKPCLFARQCRCVQLDSRRQRLRLCCEIKSRAGATKSRDKLDRRCDIGLNRARILPGQETVSGHVVHPPVNYTEYPACGRHSQPYSVGGSSGAAFRCQYCSKLFIFYAVFVPLVLRLVGPAASVLSSVCLSAVPMSVCHALALRYDT